jgi:orotidine-5'-phosphate decarboxylase
MPELSPELRAPSAYTLFLARRARESGCAGVVASALELKAIKNDLGPGFLAVVPGVRPEWSQVKNDDQKRTAAPLAALDQGADFLVVGRPIRDAADPKRAAEMTAEEISRAKIYQGSPGA